MQRRSFLASLFAAPAAVKAASLAPKVAPDLTIDGVGIKLLKSPPTVTGNTFTFHGVVTDVDVKRALFRSSFNEQARKWETSLPGLSAERPAQTVR